MHRTDVKTSSSIELSRNHISLCAFFLSRRPSVGRSANLIKGPFRSSVPNAGGKKPQTNGEEGEMEGKKSFTQFGKRNRTIFFARIFPIDWTKFSNDSTCIKESSYGCKRTATSAQVFEKSVNDLWCSSNDACSVAFQLAGESIGEFSAGSQNRSIHKISLEIRSLIVETPLKEKHHRLFLLHNDNLIGNRCEVEIEKATTKKERKLNFRSTKLES